MKYLNGYPEPLQQQARELIETDRLRHYLLKRYPQVHNIHGERALYDYTKALKNRYLKKSQPLSKACYDDKIDVIHNALGLHTKISRVHGNKLKAKREIRIASVFRRAPEAFLRMIVVHELAHFKEMEHNRAFYSLCQHMEPDYHQLELDLRLYLTQLEHFGALYQ
ncbi:MAG: M48 family metallopeptidase [Pseudomonadales bacterium]